MRDCYTGFKWIAREIALSEGKQQYIGGGEESYGFLAEDFVRDKDAVSACSLLAEICAYAKDQGKTLWNKPMQCTMPAGYDRASGTLRAAVAEPSSLRHAPVMPAANHSR